MKKVMIALAAVMCLGLVSCNKTCTCTTSYMGVSSSITVSEQMLQKFGVTCSDYAKIWEEGQKAGASMGVTVDASAKCN